MNCKNRLFKMFAVFLLASAAVSFSMQGMDSAVAHPEMQKDSLSCYIDRTEIALPSEVYSFSEVNQTPSEPLARLFQIMFILFFISPPIIAFLLFLIWRELKKRNKMK